MTDSWRPRLHFTPARNWINDPNGLIWFEGEYHLFFQYNPFGDVWGHMSWGHAVSTDLIGWTELPVAIPEADGEMAFSGSLVHDRDNRSGLGHAGRAPLVAVYTAHRAGPPQHQSQALASSLDRGRTWTRFPGNPVLDLEMAHFRDPKVFWHEPSAAFVMVVAFSEENRVAFFASPDLRRWRRTGDFGPAGSDGALWECPDLFPLASPRHGEGRRWVFKVDVFQGGVGGGSSGQVCLGDFDGETFVPDRRPDGAVDWRWADHGADFYAAASWADLPPGAGEALWLGWMNSHHYAAAQPTTPWRGAMTLPRRLALAERAGRLVLTQTPAVEAAPRGAPRPLRNAGQGATLDLAGGPAWRLALEIAAPLAGDVAFDLVWDSGDRLVFGYDADAHAVFVDRAAAGPMSERADFAQRRAAPLAGPRGETLRLEVVLDACSIELFADGGAAVITQLMFPRGALERLTVTGARSAVSGLAEPLGDPETISAPR